MTARRHLFALVAAFGLLDFGVAIGTTMHPIFAGETGLEGVYFDVRIYRDHALKSIRRTPYRDFVVEYPIVAFPLISWPILITQDPESYALLLGSEMIVVNVVALALVARRTGAQGSPSVVASRLAWYSLFFAGFCPMVLARFDLIPMTLAFASALAWSGRRPALGGVLAAVGALTKIFPGLIALPALLWASRPARRMVGHLTFAITLAAGGGLWFALAGGKMFDSIRFQTERGLEVGSLYAGLLVLAGWATGRPTSAVFAHNAMDLASPWSDQVGPWVLPIQAGAILLVLIVGCLRRVDPLRLATACLAALIVTGKVLSPQYAIWLLPFIVSLDGRPGRVARPAFLAIVLLTAFVFPHHYYGLLKQAPAVIAALNARNLLLVLLTAYLVLARDPDAP